MVNVLFWCGVVSGGIDAIILTFLLWFGRDHKIDESKLKASFYVSGFFLAAAAVAKYIGY